MSKKERCWEDEKSKLLSELLLNVKSCQSRFGSRTELATEDDPSVRHLCLVFEQIFSHGLISNINSQQEHQQHSSSSYSAQQHLKDLWQITENIVSTALRSTNLHLSFWPLIKSYLSKHEAERFLLLHSVRSDFGRSRAWLRASLNEHSLERTILLILSHSPSNFYEEGAFLRDPELSSILPQTAAGLGSILFALIVDNPLLDKVSPMERTHSEEPLAESLPELAEIADLVLDPKNTSQSPSSSTPHDSSSKSKAKNKKRKKVPTAFVSFDETESSPDSALKSPINKDKPKAENMNSQDKSPKASSKSLSIPRVQNPDLNLLNSEPSIYSTSAGGDNLSIYSDNSERFEIEIPPSDRLKPVNFDDGRIEMLDSDRSSDLIPVPSYTPPTETNSTNKSDGRSMGSDEESNNNGSDKYKVLLEHEMGVVSRLRGELAEERRNGVDGMRILEAKVEALKKENELLRHQLKKYIGAVQLLKEGGRRMSLELDDELLNSSTSHQSDVRVESVEYERKLVQVAEMHGELMEFNAYLQSLLTKKEQSIRQLRTELVDLRGPFDEDETEEEEGIINIENSSGERRSRKTPFTRSISVNERVLINIWIPSAFLTGATNDLHHVYQVFIRIKDTEWNVYRRYSHFYNFHKELKKKHPEIDSFYFPPKKHLGNKDSKFVDERRRKLQEYLRKVINHTLQTNSIIAAHPDKNLLISIMPFFGEINHAQMPKRSRSRSRSLFFRSFEPSATTNNSQASSDANVYHPQYTGL